MISFCKSSFHSFLGIPDSEDRRNIPHRWGRIRPSPDGGGLRLLATDSPKPPHVVEAPAVGPSAAGEKSAKPGAWGLREAAPSAGLGLCTESLGSESCDSGIEIDESTAKIEQRNARRPSRRRRAEMRLPPPLPWMTGRGGRRSRYLKAERRDGRFVLTEVEIDQPPEILRAVRCGGRLRLELVGIAGEDNLEGEEESPGEVEIAGEERSPENGERWELLRVRNEGQRCVEALSGDGVAPLWWNHRFATTA